MSELLQLWCRLENKYGFLSSNALCFIGSALKLNLEKRPETVTNSHCCFFFPSYKCHQVRVFVIAVFAALSSIIQTCACVQKNAPLSLCTVNIGILQNREHLRSSRVWQRSHVLPEIHSIRLFSRRSLRWVEIQKCVLQQRHRGEGEEQDVGGSRSHGRTQDLVLEVVHFPLATFTHQLQSGRAGWLDIGRWGCKKQ